MPTILTTACACTLLVIGGMASASEPSPWGQLTVTESLIRHEILRLKGDWESGSKPKLVAFIGPKFESPHFEMLTHIPTVEFFFVHDCSVDDFAVKSISSLISMKRLDLIRCEIKATCLSLLRANRELKELRMEDTKLSDQMLEGLTHLSQVETLDFDNVDLSDVSNETIAHISRMSGLKKCSLWDCPGITPEHITKLRAIAPHVDFQ